MWNLHDRCEPRGRRRELDIFVIFFLFGEQQRKQRREREQRRQQREQRRRRRRTRQRPDALHAPRRRVRRPVRR